VGNCHRKSCDTLPGVEAAPTASWDTAATDVLHALQSSPAPITARQLRQQIKGRRTTDEELTSALTGLVREGAIHTWPSYRNAARYWHFNPDDYIRDRILEIASEAALSKKELVTRSARAAHRCPQTRVEKNLMELVRSGAMRVGKPLGTSLYYRSGSTKALVTAALNVLTERLLRLGVPQGEIPQAQQHAMRRAPDLSTRILDTLCELEPSPGAPVTARALRARLQDVEKMEFDRAVIGLAESQRVYVTRHDHGWALSEQDRQQLIHDGGANLYVAVARRG